jgi:two-component system copper resistance phosphate regulon response regulator CusR
MLLVVEDERRVRDFIVRGLSEEGFQLRSASDSAGALDQLRSETFQLVVLDWRLPGSSGLELLRTLRRSGDSTPVLMLTANNDAQQRIEALNAGADDYLGKPFVFDELVARIRAIIRRSEGRSSAVLSFEDLSLDPASRRVVRAGKELRLTTREFALLQYLLEHAEEVVSRTRILEAVWEHDFETFSNVVEVYIRYLRTKVDVDFPRRLIHTVRGVGYRLGAPP